MMNLDWMTQNADETLYMEKLSNLLCTRGDKKCNNGPAQVLDHLYCGSRIDALNFTLLRRLRITHVLNCAPKFRDYDAPESPYEDGQSGVVDYLELDILDNPSYPIIQAHYARAKGFIDKAKDSGGRALVHCELGVNRSAALCVAYLMDLEQISLLRAVRQLQIDRPNILCNEGFRRQLVNFAMERNLLLPRGTSQKQVPVTETTVDLKSDQPIDP
jgi:hypothetical protein